MCGIFFSLSRRRHIEPDPATKECLERRGPDASCEHKIQIRVPGDAPDEVHVAYATFFSTVLSLRGQEITQQPLVDTDTASFLCWNGEAWKISGSHLNNPSPHLQSHYTDSINGNDTQVVFNLLLSASSHKQCTEPNTHDAVVEALSLISGPHAFVYFDAQSKRIYYGRDSLGRRSLLNIDAGEGDLRLASSRYHIAPSDDVNAASTNEPRICRGPLISEIEADGIYMIDLTVSTPFEAQSLVPHWHNRYLTRLIPYVSSDIHVPNGKLSAVMQYPSLKTSSMSTLNHEERQERQPIPVLSLKSPAVAKLEELLRRSLMLRLNGLGTPDTITVKANFNSSKLAILFSGGLDCTVLARLAHDILPNSEPIDLLNVAFENPRIHAKLTAETPYEACPDRVTGRAAFAELQNVCPHRLWRFVEIDVPYTETTAHRSTIVSLIAPHDTEMDLSIAMALYFASRGMGAIRSVPDGPPFDYTTSARVLLSGLGADELFAGYQRHATAFSRHGLQGLIDELQLDVSRLGKRNLGRDDRVLSHWSRETRFPYLDEEVVAWAMEAPVWEKTGFGSETTSQDGLSENGDDIEAGKKVLRLVALKLGMKNVAREKKRAIQFGARTAKMTTGKTRGTTLLS